jgi:hypothetical protein
MVCSHCGNEVKVAAENCPYCQKPLPISGQAPKSLRACIYIVPIAGFLIFSLSALFLTQPAFRQFFSFWRKAPAEENPNRAPVVRDAVPAELPLRATYESYLAMLENPTLEALKKFVPSQRLAELDEGGENSRIYDELIPDIPTNGIVITRVESKGNRAVIVTNIEDTGLFTDAQGNPLGATGVAQLVHEESGWKFVSQMWHVSPPTDPVAPAILWLNETTQ